ncbi:protein of unknown function [Burkholderia multivorans]
MVKTGDHMAHARILAMTGGTINPRLASTVFSQSKQCQPFSGGPAYAIGSASLPARPAASPPRTSMLLGRHRAVSRSCHSSHHYGPPCCSRTNLPGS